MAFRVAPGLFRRTCASCKSSSEAWLARMHMSEARELRCFELEAGEGSDSNGEVDYPDEESSECD